MKINFPPSHKFKNNICIYCGTVKGGTATPCPKAPQ